MKPPVIQITDNNECFALASWEEREVLRVEENDALGFVFNFPTGGTPCGNVNGEPRAARVFVTCPLTRQSIPTKLTDVKEPRRCEYDVFISSHAGCPLVCGRDPVSKAVCGGIKRGTCTENGCICSDKDALADFCESPTAAAERALAASSSASSSAFTSASVAETIFSLPLILLTRFLESFSTHSFAAGGAFVVFCIASVYGCRGLLTKQQQQLLHLKVEDNTVAPHTHALLPLGKPARLSTTVSISLAATLGLFIYTTQVGTSSMETVVRGTTAVHERSVAPLTLAATGMTTVGGDVENIAGQGQPLPPLFVVYGDIAKYWGSYAVKHFSVTTQELLRDRGWKAYVPRSDSPRDTWDEMLVNMKEQYDGRLPDVILLLQDWDLLNPEMFPSPPEFATTQRLCWIDDVTRHPPESMNFAVSHASVLLPTYEYLRVRLPATVNTTTVWVPHAALPHFELAFNPAPKRVVLLIGMIVGYPLREIIKDKFDKGDKRIELFHHPGWQPGPSLAHIDQFAAAINAHIACIMCASANNFVISKVFEVSATGSLLVITDDIADGMAALGFIDGVNYKSYNITTLDATLDWLLDPHNALEIDFIRAAGQKLVHDRHTMRHRADAIHAIALEGARVKARLDAGHLNTTYDLKLIQRFPNYNEWAWKSPASARWYGYSRRRVQ